VPDQAAQARDVAARRRDVAADARDRRSHGETEVQQVAHDRVLAAADRAAAAADRREAAARDRAAEARDEAAELRDASSADATRSNDTAGRRGAAGDRAAAAQDRQEAAHDRWASALDLQNAYRDVLTGALLRDAGRDQLWRTVERARRSRAPLVVAFLDVDRLKQVNDVWGHAAGDRVLAAVGEALRTGLRTYDVVVRWGGDEFVCALPDAEVNEAERRFAGIAAALAWSTRVSVGIAQLSGDDDLEQLVERADREMYDAKVSKTR